MLDKNRELFDLSIYPKLLQQCCLLEEFEKEIKKELVRQSLKCEKLEIDFKGIAIKLLEKI